MTRSRLRRIPLGPHRCSWSSCRRPGRRVRRPGAPGASGGAGAVTDPAAAADPGPARRRPDQPPGLAVHADLPGDVHHPGRRSTSFLEGLGVPAAIGWAIVVLTLVVRALVIPLVRQAAGLAAPDAAAPARGQGDPEALQGRRDEGARRPAGAVQGTRHQPARGLPPAPAPDAPAVHHVLGHPERADQRRPDARCSTVFGVQVVPLDCNNINPSTGVPDATPRGRASTRSSRSSAAHRRQPARRRSSRSPGFGISILAIVSALLQLVQSRMMLPPASRRRRPEHQDPAPDDALPAADLDRVRRLPAGRPVHLLDHRDDLRDRPAVPHRGLGRDVPAVRLDAGVRRRPHPAIPRVDATTT